MNPQQPDIAIQFADVRLRAGDSVLVDGLSLVVHRGEVMVLLGRSGSGKTSTLKLANRLLVPTSGTVTVEGKDAKNWEPTVLRRRMGYVIQNAGLFPHFTVRENVGLVPLLEGWPESDTLRRVEEVLQLVGLDPDVFGARYPRELSGGQQQRVGVARALAVDPPMLLMDEPFGALDPLTRDELQNEFRQLQGRLHKTVVFVTHDVAEALALGSRIAYMENGRIVMEGTPGEFLKSSHPSVQAFLQPFHDLLDSLKAISVGGI